MRLATIIAIEALSILVTAGLAKAVMKRRVLQSERYCIVLQCRSLCRTRRERYCIVLQSEALMRQDFIATASVRHLGECTPCTCLYLRTEDLPAVTVKSTFSEI